MPNGRYLLELEILESVRVCDEHYRLRLLSPHALNARPGQFLQLRCQRRPDANRAPVGTPSHDDERADPTQRLWAEGPVLLPRPFSIAGVRDVPRGSQIDVLLRVVGRGTAWLACLRAGDRISALGPLGNGFAIPSAPRRAYLVGGGIGLPPMIWLARALSSRGCDVLSFCGARTRRLLALSLIGEPSASAAEPRMAAEEFASSRTPVVLATDDGSLGVKGRVSTAMEDYHSAHPCPSDELIVYTCGPEPMMRSVARWCHDRGIACQVCMERMMGCGIGTCQSCVVAIRDPSAPRGFVYKLCCKDGPVFDAETVDWSQAVPRSVYTPPY